MARCIPDPVSGLPWRPYKSTAEMDTECETVLRRFLGLPPAAVIPLPLSTDLLTSLIEDEAERLDLFADLARDVEGCTNITAQRRPWVRINRRLSTAPQRAHRLRHTLAHEWYHVMFHAPFYQAHLTHEGRLALAPAQRESPQGLRPPRPTPGTVDWREWQAAYGAGALLMPRTALRHLLWQHHEVYGLPPYQEATGEAAAVAALVAACCDVSPASALIRLGQQGWVAPAAGAPCTTPSR